MEKAVEVIREILADHEGMNADFPPRVFFNGFNDFSLNIMIVVWYHPPNYWDYQGWLQKVCLEIMRRFETEGIDFAFPTRTVHLANDDKRQLKIQMLDAFTTQVSDGTGGKLRASILEHPVRSSIHPITHGTSQPFAQIRGHIEFWKEKIPIPDLSQSECSDRC